MFTMMTLALLAAAEKADIGRQVFDATNAYRLTKKLPKYVWDKRLTKVAQDHAEALAKLDKSGDDGDPHFLNGRGPAGRLTAAGYRFDLRGENIGRTNATLKDYGKHLTERWVKSIGHEAAIASQKMTHTGVGYARAKSGMLWVVQVFALPAKEDKKDK